MLVIAQSGEKCVLEGTYQPACPRLNCCERTTYEEGNEFKFCSNFHWMVWHFSPESQPPIEDSMIHEYDVPYDLAYQNVRFVARLILRQ